RRRSHGTGDSGTGSSPSTSYRILRTCVLNLSLDNRPVPIPSIPPDTKTPQKFPVAVPGPCRLLLDRVPWGGEVGGRGAAPLCRFPFPGRSWTMQVGFSDFEKRSDHAKPCCAVFEFTAIGYPMGTSRISILHFAQ